MGATITDNSNMPITEGSNIQDTIDPRQKDTANDAAIPAAKRPINMQYDFRGQIAITYYKDTGDDKHAYWFALPKNTAEATETMHKAIEDGASSMEISAFRTVIYTGALRETAMHEAIAAYMGDEMYPLVRCNADILDEKVKNSIIRYLEAMKRIVAVDSDDDEALYQRDTYFGEDAEIQKCINLIKSIEPA